MFNVLFLFFHDCTFAETGAWSILETQGDKPRARDKLQGVAVGTSIYYFGGFGPKSDGFEDVRT